MSFELYVFDSTRVGTVEEARELVASGAYFDVSRPHSDRTARKWKTANRLVASHRHLRAEEFDIPAMARWEKLAPEAFDAKNAYVPVGDPDGSDPVRFTVFDDVVEIYVEPPPETATFESVAESLRESLSGLAMHGMDLVFDPQGDRLLESDADATSIAAAYRFACERPPQSSGKPAAAAAAASPGKPWWKLW